MKVFNLKCCNGHVFEGWFADVERCDRDAAERKIECPECGVKSVERIPTAPHVVRESVRKDAAIETKKREAFWSKVRDQASKAVDVGDEFVETVREIHAGVKPEQNVKGKCTVKDAAELLKEGIAVLPVPESAGKTIN